MRDSFLRLLALVFTVTSLSIAQEIPAALREGLASEFNFSPADFSKAEAGQAVARMAETTRPDDLRMGGLVLIHVSSDTYIAALRDIERFQISPEVVKTKRFSATPTEADLDEFPFAGVKKEEILACRPGHCAIKMPAAEMALIQKGVDWNSPNALAEAHRLIAQRIAAYVNRYRLEGDKALAVYYDSPAPYSVAEGLHSLIGSETRIARAMPDLIRYATEYPNHRPNNVESFLYWQEAAFGLKHVLRTQHVLIQTLPVAGDRHYAVISKMLFATHYFRAAIEYTYVYPIRLPDGDPAIYVVTAQRSFVDGMTGLKGGIVRHVAESRSPARLAENLQLAKQRLEHK